MPEKQGSFLLRHKGAVLVVILFPILVLGSLWLLGRFLVVSRPIENPDAIVVLAGSAEYEERNLEAARLYREGAAPRIILTNDGVRGGWNNELGRNPYYVEKARWLLLANGVPEAAIEEIPEPIRDRGEIGTEVEAKKVLAYCRDKGYGRLLIVTSAYHTLRAFKTYSSESEKFASFAKLGISYPHPALRDIPGIFWWSNPSNWRRIVGEYAKMSIRVFAFIPSYYHRLQILR